MNCTKKCTAAWVLACGALLLLASAPARAQDQEQNYTRGEAYIAFGPGFANGKRGDFEFVNNITGIPFAFTTAAVEARLDYNTAFSIRTGALLNLGNHWAAGGEYTYVRTPFDLTADGVADVLGFPTRVTLSLEDLGGTEHQFAAHVYYFLADPRQRARPYIFGGPALDWFFLRDSSEITLIDALVRPVAAAATVDPAFALAKEKDLSWGVNFGTGVRVRLTPRIGIFMEGRSLWSNTPQKLFPLGRATIRVDSTGRAFQNTALKFNTPTRFLLQLNFGLSVYF